MDEEHDYSYESDNSPRYRTNEIVEFYGNHLKIPIIFASATPKITTLYQAKKWESTLIHLLEKYKWE